MVILLPNDEVVVYYYTVFDIAPNNKDSALRRFTVLCTARWKKVAVSEGSRSDACSLTRGLINTPPFSALSDCRQHSCKFYATLHY